MTLVHEPDLGTPARTDERTVTLIVDGVPVTVPAGTSVMRAAGETGCAVPKLCATDSLEPFGSCRLCLVEIEGRKGYPASCTTLVAEAVPLHRGRRTQVWETRVTHADGKLVAKVTQTQLVRALAEAGEVSNKQLQCSKCTKKKCQGLLQNEVANKQSQC